MKKIVVLIALLSIAFSAFGGGQTDDGMSGEPRVVTYGFYNDTKEEYLDHYQTTVGQYLLEEFNVKLEFYPSSETTYREELVTDAATDSLPDIITIWVYPNDPNEILVLQKAAREGLLAPLNDAIDEYAPNIKEILKNSENYPIYAQEYMADPTFDGETYLLPTQYAFGEKRPPGWAFLMRNDVMQQLDLDPPYYWDNTDDFIEILRRVKELNPVDINGNAAWATGAIRRWNPVLASYTRRFDVGGADGIDIDGSGNIIHFIETEQAWQQILFMRQLINEGLLDPEALTHTFEVGKEKVAQGKYIVEPFFAGGGLRTNYHKATVEANPDFFYPVLGNFYTNKGSNGPLLVNNLGMQTQFLNAVSSKADLSAVMPLLDFYSTPEGLATVNYGVMGTTWDWDSDGNAVLRPEYVEDYLSTDTPQPFQTVHGTARVDFLTSMMGTNHPSRNIFAGTNKPKYIFDPWREDEMVKRIGESYDQGRKLITENGMSLGGFLQSYPKKDDVSQLLSTAYINETVMLPAYLAGSESDARALLEDYRASVKKAGIDDYLQYLQEIYDADPDRYVVYESLGG